MWKESCASTVVTFFWWDCLNMTSWLCMCAEKRGILEEILLFFFGLSFSLLIVFSKSFNFEQEPKRDLMWSCIICIISCLPSLPCIFLSFSYLTLILFPLLFCLTAHKSLRRNNYHCISLEIEALCSFRSLEVMRGW